MSEVSNFNPNDVGVDNGNFFGLPYSPFKAKIVFISIPWDVTTSYKPGTAKGPQAILDASTQVDYFDFDMPDAWQIGHGTVPMNLDILKKSVSLRKKAQEIIEHLEEGGSLDDEEIAKKQKKINKASRELNDYVYHTTAEWLDKGKLVGLVGGEHSVPYGYMKALGERHKDFGILQIDAHADLRKAYEGFTFSHASIMYNALSLPGVKNLVQVGVRDICQDEIDLVHSDKRISLFDDYQLKYASYEGKTWALQCDEIVAKLPKKVYVSFDIDGLTPEHSPNTGTPVVGGLSFHQAMFLVKKVVDSGRTIIGFDLNEVAPDKHSEWDANVGARVLYKLSNFMWKSNTKLH